jgi:anti-sigma factor RsiW
MSEDDIIDPADGGKLIAAEYVLGVLGAEERREVERRLAQEPALASEVAFWEERLTGLADAVAPVSPPQATWSRIETAIGSRPGLHRFGPGLHGFAQASISLAEPRILAQLRYRLGDARGREHRPARLYRLGAFRARAADGDARRQRGPAELRRRGDGKR